MDYVFAVRSLSKGTFTNEPGATHFLEVPGNSATPKPAHKISKRAWLDKVIARSKQGGSSGPEEGDIVIYVHGFNNDQKSVLRRQRALRKGLEAHGFDGVVIAFDWPSADSAFNYLEDRKDAKATAIKLVDEGIRSFAALQTQDCKINTHIVAHSMGCYVVREAFDDADDRRSIAARSWSVSQVAFLGADVSASSMAPGNPKTSSLYRHCVRLTNYFNPFDNVLKLSSVKRVGVSARAGRIGVERPEPDKLVDLNCGPYFEKEEGVITGQDDSAHNWYFSDARVLEDLAHTIRGNIDRRLIPTRAPTNLGGLALRHPKD
ncbi:MAG: alpha/beta hydrolase [Pseudomonadota bacterium]